MMRGPIVCQLYVGGGGGGGGKGETIKPPSPPYVINYNLDMYLDMYYILKEFIEKGLTYLETSVQM